MIKLFKYVVSFVLISYLMSGCESVTDLLSPDSGEKDAVIEYSYTYDDGTQPLFNTSTTNIFNITNRQTMGVQYTKIYPDGTTYRGTLVDGKREGFGTTTWIDGSKYIGEYKNDKESGRGIFIYSNGKREVGIFEGGKRVK